MLRDSLTVRNRIQGKGSMPGDGSMGRSGDWCLKLREEDVGEKASSLGKTNGWSCSPRMAGQGGPNGRSLVWTAGGM